MQEPTTQSPGRPLSDPEEGPRTARVTANLTQRQHTHLLALVEREGLRTLSDAIAWLINLDAKQSA